jgi:hypothetical protein
MTPRPDLPRNLLDEIEAALADSPGELDDDWERFTALQELRLIGRRLSFELGRPVAVTDVIHDAEDDGERARRRELLRLLRPSERAPRRLGNEE